LRLPDYLGHILDASKQARSYVEGIDQALFLDNRMVQQAVILNLIVIGEAAVQIETEYPDFASANSVVPWKKLRGMRNRMTHGYFDTNLEIIWDTVQAYLPELEHFLSNCPELNVGDHRPRPPGVKI
jgi:uncharacterized protein with HEPN domain